MWTPNRRIRKGKRLGSFLFCFPGLPLPLSYVFPCLPVLVNGVFLRAQNPVCSTHRNLEGICESAIQALLTLGTKLKSNKDHCWVRCSGGEMEEQEISSHSSAFLLFFVFCFSQSCRYASFIDPNKSHRVFCLRACHRKDKNSFAALVTYFPTLLCGRPAVVLTLF